MKRVRRIRYAFCLAGAGMSLVWACAHDDTLREYLSVRFWLPFAKSGRHFARLGVRRLSAPYAGMEKAREETPLGRLRAAYQRISIPDSSEYDTEKLQQALAAARSAPGLSAREREEIELIDAKIDLRAGSRENSEPLVRAKGKLNEFLRKGRTPEFLSEARGWLGYAHFLLGEQTQAGKIYLDELNRSNSNLSREVLVTSLRMTYGYDGGQELLDHLEEYFDTAEHAAFAIQLATNPRWKRNEEARGRDGQSAAAAPPYARIAALLEKHRGLLRSEKGAGLLALLGMRIALAAGDPPAARHIAAQVPRNAATRGDPDFNWMLASVQFLSRDYASAEAPLLRLFGATAAPDPRKAAAAYGLCGVYQKLGRPVEQIRFALWLNAEARRSGVFLGPPTGIENLSVYWASSGWDLGLLLDAEAPVEALREFSGKYPDASDAHLVKYSLAVRLARANQYEEAERIYREIGAPKRAERMRRLQALHAEASRAGAGGEARYKLAEYLSGNSDRLYFNDALWHGFQGYALVAESDSRLTGQERRRLLAAERKLKDDQEELWRAYLILREVAREAGGTDLGQRAARLGVRCLRRISSRFGREKDIRAADLELSGWLAGANPAPGKSPAAG